MKKVYETPEFEFIEVKFIDDALRISHITIGGEDGGRTGNEGTDGDDW